MANEDEKKGAPAVPPPVYKPEPPKIDWRRTGFRIVGFIVVIALLVIAGIWITNSSQNGTSTRKTPSTSQKPAPKRPSSSTDTKKQAQSTPKKKSQPARVAQNRAASNQTGAVAAGKGQGLTNTGPGDTLGIFAAVTVAGMGLHYIITLRRLKTDS